MVVDLGGAIGILFATVKEITKKNVMFKPSLESLRATLEILKPLMDEVKQLNEELTQRQQESTYYESQINEGEKYVRKCFKVCRYNIFKKSNYTNKLLELDRTLKSLIVSGLSARDSKETLILARKIFDFQIAASGSSASVSNQTLILVQKILAKMQGEQGINIVEPADQVISIPSSHTPPPPKPEPEPELEPVPLIWQETGVELPQPPPPPPPPPPFGDTESHEDIFEAELAGGTTFGEAFRSLLDAVEKSVIKGTVIMFPVMHNVRATLEVLKPLICEIEKFHTQLNLPNRQIITDLKLEMEKGAKLIQKCSKVRWYDLLKKKHYQDMLLRLDEILVRLFEILQIESARDVKQSLVLVREVHANIVEHGGINDVGLNQILSRVSSINVGSSPTVPPGGYMREEPPSTKVLSG